MAWNLGSQCTLAQSLRLSHALEYGNGGLRWLICEFRNDAADICGDASRLICCVCVVAPGEDRTCTRAALRELYLHWLLFMLRSALEGQRRTHEQPYLAARRWGRARIGMCWAAYQIPRALRCAALR